MSVDKVWQALGGKKVLGARPTSALAFVPMARIGFPFGALEATAGSLGRSVEATAKVINIPQRTMYSRKSTNRLNPDESDRVLRLALVIAEADDVLGSREKTQRWLSKPSRALGGQTPESLLVTEYGAQLVREELSRIEHGVFA
jgi:putative toxin-antitoxin system antitoxin component (TIGR02293 family)